MSKRQFGSIRKLSSGRYQVRFRDPATRQLAPAPFTFRTIGEASSWLARAEADLLRGERLERYSSTETLADYSEAWLDHRVLRPRTVELYRGLLDRHILPVLGGLELGQIAPATVRSWHAQLSRAERPGPVTVAKSYRLLRTICETAVSDDILSRNPCSIKGASSEHSPERPTLSIEQVDAIAAAIERRYRGMVLLATWCTLRLGEVMALTRSDVDLEMPSVSVTKSVAELKSGERRVGPPKTTAGVRSVAIPPHVVPAISDHLAEFTGPRDEDLMFVGVRGLPVRRNSVYAAWKRACGEVGLEGVRFHDLRHTGATLAAATGASTKELMARLGHSSSAAAIRYQHASTSRDLVIASRLSELATEGLEVKDRDVIQSDPGDNRA